ncbi:MAG: hypothetical protein WC869_00535 [Phycisphaerae bacterium]|jgi:hypothetical protein
MLFADVSLLNAQAQVVRDAAVNGTLILKSGTGQTLATFALGAAPFAAPINGVINLATPLLATAVFTGTATYFELYRSDLSLILRGSVGIAAGDLVLTDTAVVTGYSIRIDTLAYVAPEV